METPSQSGIKILAFGIAGDVIKKNSMDVAGISDTDALQSWLFERYPRLKGMQMSIAVNREIIQTNTPLPEGAEVALLPPYSGG